MIVANGKKRCEIKFNISKRSQMIYDSMITTIAPFQRFSGNQKDYMWPLVYKIKLDLEEVFEMIYFGWIVHRNRKSSSSVEFAVHFSSHLFYT